MGSVTPNLGFYKPASSETGWGVLLNTNWGILDAIHGSSLGFYRPAVGERDVSSHIVANWAIVNATWPGTGALDTPMYHPGWGTDWNANWDVLDAELATSSTTTMPGLYRILTTF